MKKDNINQNIFYSYKLSKGRVQKPQARKLSVGGVPPRSLKSGTTATMVGGPKEFGGTKGMFTVFFLRIFGRLFWSSHNLCSVPSNSVYGPPKIIVLSPQIPFIVPQKSLFCPLLITNHCSPTKIIVMSPQIPLIPYQIPFIVPQKYCFVPS